MITLVAAFRHVMPLLFLYHIHCSHQSDPPQHRQNAGHYLDQDLMPLLHLKLLELLAALPLAVDFHQQPELITNLV